LLLGIAMSLFAGDAALACKCRLLSADELLNASDVIFEGAARRTRPTGGRSAVTAFRIVAAYKGVTRGQLVRVQHLSGPSASCGVHFARGRTHLISASREAAGAPLSASACMLASMRTDPGKELVQRLGR
jgi:hypothetical protein